MADNKSIELTMSGGGHKSSDHDHKSNSSKSTTRQRLGAECLLVVAVILLALTAQVFRKDVLAEPHFSNTEVQANCTGLVAPVCQIYASSAYGCVAIPDPAATDCGAPNAGFQCWQGKCVSSTDPANAFVCNSPPDSRCSALDSGIYHNGDCHYAAAPDFTRCHPKYSDPKTNEAETVLLGWSCQQGVCTSPAKQLIGNNAYQWSINAGLIAAALAIEVLATGTFTPDLVFLAINAGLILLGFDGKLQDLSLEFNYSIGRTQVAFGFIVGSLAFYYGFRLLQSVKNRENDRASSIFAAVLIAFHGVTIGLVAHLWGKSFNSYENGEFQTYNNVSYNWAYPASIYAAMVAVAASLSALFNGKPSSAFGAFTLFTGLVELAWASANVDEDAPAGSFTDTANAWQSFAIISGVFSVVFGAVWAKPSKKSDSGKNNKGFALVSLVVFFTMIGIVASLYQNAFLDAEADVYGTNPRFSDFTLRDEENFSNQVSTFAWEHSIWTAVVVSAFAFEALAGGSSTGIAALALVKAANLVGWAAEHHYIGSITGKENLSSRTRAWEALSLVAGIIAFLAAASTLRGPSESTSTVHTEENNSIEAADRENFATRGSNQA